MMFNGKLTVTHHHRATVQEISVEMNGFSFLCLFGRHINGAYISIVSLGVSAELSPSKNGVGYNSDRIFHALQFADYSRRGMIDGWERDFANALSRTITPMLSAKAQRRKG